MGDRSRLQASTGEVADVGLFRPYLMELGGRGFALKPTGPVVVFPNSVFFQPAAVFKQVPVIDYAWRSITLKVSGTADYAAIESRLLAVVESIYAEYRDVLVQIRRINEIDDRVTREVMRQFENDPNLTITTNSGSKGEVAVG